MSMIPGKTRDRVLRGMRRRKKAMETNFNLYERLKGFICVYAYRGQETEGRLQQFEHFVCEARNGTEALYKYHVWLFMRGSHSPGYVFPWKSLEEYKKFEYADGGWGYCAYELAGYHTGLWSDENKVFDEFYKQYA